MLSSFLAIFLAVFLAELGDKTQLATLLFASNPETPKILVFLAAASALLATTALAVAAGALFDRHLAALPLKGIAGVGFIAIGVWSLYGQLSGG